MGTGTAHNRIGEVAASLLGLADGQEAEATLTGLSLAPISQEGAGHPRT
jgi:hypothetical protein